MGAHTAEICYILPNRKFRPGAFSFFKNIIQTFLCGRGIKRISNIFGVGPYEHIAMDCEGYQNALAQRGGTLKHSMTER